MNHKMRGIAAKNHKTSTTFMWATLAAVLLSTVPGSTLANAKSYYRLI
jgi:hypothetical protein